MIVRMQSALHPSEGAMMRAFVSFIILCGHLFVGCPPTNAQTTFSDLRKAVSQQLCTDTTRSSETRVSGFELFDRKLFVKTTTKITDTNDIAVTILFAKIDELARVDYVGSAANCDFVYLVCKDQTRNCFEKIILDPEVTFSRMVVTSGDLDGFVIRKGFGSELVNRFRDFLQTFQK